MRTISQWRPSQDSLFRETSLQAHATGRKTLSILPLPSQPQGTIIPPETPGLGFNVNLARIDSLTVRKETIVRKSSASDTNRSDPSNSQQMASKLQARWPSNFKKGFRKNKRR